MNENDQLDVRVEALSDAWISVLAKVGDGDGYPSYPLELRPGSGRGTVSIAFAPRDGAEETEVPIDELRFGLNQVKKRELPSWPGIYAEPVEVSASTAFEERPLQITDGTDPGRVCLRRGDGLPGRELAFADLEQGLDMLDLLAPDLMPAA